MPADRIDTLQVQGLFGYLDHEIEFRKQGTTILTGPNGSGKTHLLKILRALAAVDLADLVRYPFDAAELSYEGGTALRATRIEDGDAAGLHVAGSSADGSSSGAEADLPEPMLRPFEERELPPWLERLGADEWFDERSGEYVSTDDVVRVYGTDAEPPYFAAYPWLKAFLPAAPPTFIETGRLDVSLRVDRPARPGRPQRRRRPGRPAIERYVERIRDQIIEARRASLSVSQEADREFAARALDKARASVRESDLRRRYEQIASLHRELHANGLTEQAIEVAFPQGRTNPTERRILNVFLDDWQAKLDELLPVHQKLQVLRAIVESKMRDKEFRISPRGDIYFVSPAGEPVSVGLLSSGEQHMLALFTMFLFTAAPSSVVLIDEPEISLHAAWKHEFLDDIGRVSGVIPVTVVMATHSTALINSRWDLVEELGLSDDEP